MDKVALRQLVRSGVSRAEGYWREHEPNAGVTPEVAADSVLDRVIQIGQIALAHEEPWLLDEVLEGMLDIYRIGLPANRDTWRPSSAEANWMFVVGSRIWILGAEAVQRGRFDVLPRIVLQQPVEPSRTTTYWLRYTVTMAARGETKKFLGKSLIGPISELIREKPQFFGTFQSNVDEAVNSLCQFDFLACVITAIHTNSLVSVYPNFAGYYSERALPIVERLIADGPPRLALPGVSDQVLAQTLRELDKLASDHFFDVNGWHGYSAPVASFVQRHVEGHSAG